jgi:hypothetical protein
MYVVPLVQCMWVHVLALGLAREAKRCTTPLRGKMSGEGHSSGAMRKESERVARVLFSFCSLLLERMSSPFPFKPVHGCLALPRSWSMGLGQGDLFGASEKSGFGTLVRHGSRHNREELEDESVTGMMTSSATPWIMYMCLYVLPP